MIGILLRMLNRGLHSIECLAARWKTPSDLPVLFIIGAPRSGSTLLYQVLVDRYRVGYLCNLHSLFYGCPSFVEVLLRCTRNKSLSDYRSLHGKTKGAYAPSECGRFWYRFFRVKPTYVSLADADPSKMQDFSRCVSLLLRAFGGPLIFKNLFCSLRLFPIATYLPNSYFIVIHRDWVDNGESILKGREKTYGNVQRWWSTEPPNLSKLLQLPPEEQVIEQIVSIHEEIERARASIGDNRFIDISYEELCQDVHKTIQDLGCELNRRGIALEVKHDLCKLPKMFDRRKERVIDPELYRKLVAYVKKSRRST